MPRRRKLAGFVTFVLLLSANTIIWGVAGMEFLPREYTAELVPKCSLFPYRYSTSDQPNAHFPFGADGFYYLNLTEVAKGANVWGNITFYYPMGIYPPNPRVYLLSKESYDNANWGNLGWNSIPLSEKTQCCENKTSNTFGYAFNFRFVSDDVKSYVSMFNVPFAQRALVNFCTNELREKTWVLPAKIIGWVLTGIVVVYTFIPRKKGGIW